MTLPFRIGHGVDVHPFSAEGSRPLVLGGVAFPGEPGLEGHSDGDVVLHALTDALLGAVALGDLGEQFGTDDPALAGAASSVFVTGALQRVRAGGWAPGNVDVTVIAQRPHLGPRRAEMAGEIAALLGLPLDAVSVKATSPEGLGFLGRAEGITCLVAALLVRDDVDPGATL